MCKKCGAHQNEPSDRHRLEAEARLESPPPLQQLASWTSRGMECSKLQARAQASFEDRRGIFSLRTQRSTDAWRKRRGSAHQKFPPSVPKVCKTRKQWILQRCSLLHRTQVIVRGRCPFFEANFSSRHEIFSLIHGSFHFQIAFAKVFFVSRSAPLSHDGCSQYIH